MKTSTAPPFWSRHLSREIQVVLDLAVLVAAFALAYSLRFDFSIPPENLEWALIQLPIVVLVQFTILLLIGIYQFVWRYIGLHEVAPFVRGATYAAVPMLLMRFALPHAFQQWRIPLSVIVLDVIFAFGGVLALRVLRRGLYEKYERELRAPEGQRKARRTLLVGAGRAGVLAIREITSRGNMEMEPVGFVDDDPLKKGTIIHGAKVVGTTQEIPRLLDEFRVDQALITMAVAAPETIRSIVETCERAGVDVKIIPGIDELLRGTVSIGRFRKIQIEDILGREPVKLDTDAVRSFLTGKSVLVTGAGGSIGSELARQIARFNPLRLVLVERAEPALFEIDQELRQIWPQLDLKPRVGDVGDEPRMRSLMARYRPHVVFHAAAHKHVPMMEQNATEAIKNNVFATATVGRVAADFGVEAFVLISTDKAVNPTSLMGASKRVAELLIQDLDKRYEGTRFLAVRFGNVLGSTGSVVPLFRKQIQQGGPVTVTHPDATRYFMTIPEAAQLVMEAGAIGSGGAILLLDMGEPIKILDLAKEMIRLSGFQPFDEIPIVFTGMRPGEKLFEELELSNERIDRTAHPKIFLGKLSSCPPEELERRLRELEEAVALGQDDGIRSILSEMVHEARLEKPDPAAVNPVQGRPRDVVN